MHLKHLTVDSIIFSDKQEKQHVIREMLTKMSDLGKIKIVPRYYAQVIHRESLENTGIGNGFAIPHARTDSVDKLQLQFCVLDEPIEYEAFDGVPVKYLLLSIFPSSYSTTYLYYISMMARLFSDSEAIAELDAATTPEAVHAVLEQKSSLYFDNLAEKNDTSIEEKSALAGVPSADLELLVRLDRLYKMLDKKEDDAVKEKITGIEHLIDNRSLTYYKRMRKKCAVPFAFVEKQACSGCNMNIPPIELNQIRERKSISVCSNCGRFLLSL